jgi:hypothetical protein
LPQFWERPDAAHLRNHLAAFLPAAAAATAVWRQGLRAPLLRRGLFAILTVLALGLAAFPWLGRRRGPEPAPYPTLAAQLQHVNPGYHPPWAGQLAQEPGTLIVLWWGPGWYVVEDMPMGTKVLSTFPRHHDAASIARLVGDLERPSNRWVITNPTGEVPAAAIEALDRVYEKQTLWGVWELWRRRDGDPQPSRASP